MLLGNEHLYLLSYLAGPLILVFKNTCFKKALKLGSVAHDCNPSIWESEASVNGKEMLSFKKQKQNPEKENTVLHVRWF